MDNYQDKNTSFFRFEDLRIYAKAVDYAVWVSDTLTRIDNDMQRNLAASFSHSAYDISLNIAEGSARSRGQFEHYLKISKTAIRECIVFTTVAHRLGMLNDEEETASRESLMEMTRMIGALVISLQRGNRRRQDDENDVVSEENGDDLLDKIETDF